MQGERDRHAESTEEQRRRAAAERSEGAGRDWRRGERVVQCLKEPHAHSRERGSRVRWSLAADRLPMQAP